MYGISFAVGPRWGEQHEMLLISRAAFCVDCISHLSIIFDSLELLSVVLTTLRGCVRYHIQLRTIVR